MPILLTLLLFFSQTATATSAAPEAQNVQNPSVTFADGLLTVQVKEVLLKALLEEIGQKAGIGVSVGPSLEVY